MNLYNSDSNGDYTIGWQFNATHDHEGRNAVFKCYIYKLEWNIKPIFAYITLLPVGSEFETLHCLTASAENGISIYFLLEILYLD